MDECTNFRNNMRYLRLKKGLTATALGDAIAHTSGWITCTETGAYTRRPKTIDMIAIAKVLGTTVEEMLKPLPDGIVLYISPEEHETGLENLEKIRRHRKMLKAVFAKKIGVTNKHYSQVINGYSNFSIKAWWRIAKNLKMNLNVLLGRDAE